MSSPLLRTIIALTSILSIAFACLAVNNGDSEPPTTVPQTVCSRCSNLYAPNCNGLKGRHLCLTSTQAQVHRTVVGGKCIFNYTCPAPTYANAWVAGHGPGPLVITGELHCNAPNYVWRNADYGPISKFSCMSEARTRCGGCVDIYKPKDPCLVSNCAPRDYVSLWVIKDPANKMQCLMNFLCPVGTEAYVFVINENRYVRATGQPLACVDHGPGSAWYHLLPSPTRNVRIDHVSCFSAT
ncbi:hypothetical protein Aduo_016530 [Ancylostoma duodenale]